MEPIEPSSEAAAENGPGERAEKGAAHETFSGGRKSGSMKKTPKGKVAEAPGPEGVAPLGHYRA